MLFFAFEVFIFWYKTLTEKKSFFINSAITSILLMIAFFSKQSMISLFGLIFFSYIFFFVLERKGKRKVVLKKYRQILVGLALVIPITLVLYCLGIYLPADKTSWLMNYSYTIGGNRPKMALLNPSYTLSQLIDFLSSNYWQYLPFLNFGLFFYLYFLYLRFKKWGKIFDFGN